jgi:hypothetical protein
VEDRDERKSAGLAARNLQVDPGTQLITRFAFGRDLLRSPAMRQAAEIGVDRFDLDNHATAPVIFLDGEPHRRKRAAIAKFFTPKAVTTQYRVVMERVADALLQTLQETGRARLDVISFELAVTVAAEIVGLTDSDGAAMSRRIASAFESSTEVRRSRLAKALGRAVIAVKTLHFFYRDVLPAIRSRRKTRRDDVISQLLDHGASNEAILMECMVYASAGMVTTREFIVMAAWHLFERDDLRARFVEGGEDEQFAILEEILRLEPVAAMVFRRAAEDVRQTAGGAVRKDTRFAIDIRAANTDEAVTGPCPHAIDPDRARDAAPTGAYLSFGDGAHRCPGAQVAMHETRVFLDRLFRVPGIRLERTPDMRWNEALLSYELRHAIVTCDRTVAATS